jgi:hypothetical protein
MALRCAVLDAPPHAAFGRALRATSQRAHPRLAPRRAQKTFLTYRELVKDPEAQVNRLYRFLGVDQKQPVRVNATMKMDTASRLADEIENLQEVEEALRGTSYLKELYDLQFYGYTDR